jgi:hypothetical protein
MYVLVHHQIIDPEKFLSIVQSGAPYNPHFQVYAFLPAINRTAASCLWEATDTNSLQIFLDPILGNSSTNTYLQVDEKIAIGLPSLRVMEMEEN